MKTYTDCRTTADFVEYYKNTSQEKLQKLFKNMTGTMGMRMQAKKAALTILTTK
jgi:hypothetical protein